MKRKFNAIDIIVVVVVAIIIIGCYKYFSKDNSKEDFKIGKEKITFIFEAGNILPELSNKVVVDDILLDDGKYQDAIIKKVEVFDHEEVIAIDGVLNAVNNPTIKRVYVTIEASVNRYGPYMDLGGQAIKANEVFWLRTDKITMLGKIVNVL
jgi:hypothetical protein